MQVSDATATVATRGIVHDRFITRGSVLSIRYLVHERHDETSAPVDKPSLAACYVRAIVIFSREFKCIGVHVSEKREARCSRGSAQLLLSMMCNGMCATSASAGMYCISK
jgi:hypothetical protein